VPPRKRTGHRNRQNVDSHGKPYNNILITCQISYNVCCSNGALRESCKNKCMTIMMTSRLSATRPWIKSITTITTPSLLNLSQCNSKSNHRFVQHFIMTHLQSTRVWHVLTRDHSFTCHPHVYPQVEINHTCLYSPATQRHHTFGWYSFSVPLRVGG